MEIALNDGRRTSGERIVDPELTLSLPIVPLIDFTLSNARRFYSSMGNPTGLKGLTKSCSLTSVYSCMAACASPV